jgi:predicted porin
MVGGRIVLRTPLAGLGVGLSGYKGEVGQIDETGEDIHLPQTTFGGYLDYAGDRALLRAEAFRHLLGSSDARTRMDGWYTEGAYRVFGPWQLAARYERMDMDMSMGMGMMPAMASLMRHEAVTFGLNYWFDMGFVLKASYHNVEGNRFAHPTDVSELRQAIMDGDLPPSTDAFLIGAQFSF